MNRNVIRLASCVAASILSATAAHADSLVFGTQGGGVWDQTTNLYWDSFTSLADGAAAGYRAATAADVSALFDDRAADVQFWTHGTGYVPGSGSYNLSWGFNWTGPSTPLGSAFIDPTPCPRAYCGSYYSTFDIDLLADAGGGAAALVSLRAARTVSQYGYSISESGGILPAAGGAAGYLMVKAVPEPSTYALVGIGLAAAAAVARRRKRG